MDANPFGPASENVSIQGLQPKCMENLVALRYGERFSLGREVVRKSKTRICKGSSR